jgi:hypothetical protein
MRELVAVNVEDPVMAMGLGDAFNVNDIVSIIKEGINFIK